MYVDFHARIETQPYQTNRDVWIGEKNAATIPVS